MDQNSLGLELIEERKRERERERERWIKIV